MGLIAQALIHISLSFVSSELTNLPGKVQQEVSSSLEQSEQPILEEVCSLRSTVEETMASAKASVETVKSSVEAVGRAVEDMQENEAEGREELKRAVEEARFLVTLKV